MENINESIENTNKQHLRRKEISTKIKKTVFNTIFKLTLTFGCKSLTLTKQQKVKYKQWR